MGDEVRSSGNNTKPKKASLRNKMKKHNDSKAHQAGHKNVITEGEGDLEDLL